MNTFKSLVASSGLFTPDHVGVVVKTDAQAAFTGLCEVLARQTEDERSNKGTSHKNKFGFSKREVTRGTYLAQKFQAGQVPLTMDEVAEACQIAYRYRQQLWMIALGAVPVNNLNLNPNRTPSED